MWGKQTRSHVSLALGIFTIFKQYDTELMVNKAKAKYVKNIHPLTKITMVYYSNQNLMSIVVKKIW